MSDAKKSSALPYVIVGAVGLAIGWHYLSKRRKVDPATESSTDPEATSKPSPGGLLDGLIGGIKNIGAQVGNLRDLFGEAGGKESTDGSGQSNNKRITGATDPYYARGAKDRTLRKTRSRLMPGAQAPTWGSTWADRTAAGDYN